MATSEVQKWSPTAPCHALGVAAFREVATRVVDQESVDLPFAEASFEQGVHGVRHHVGAKAMRRGNAVVAPVLAYVPEGNITPPEAHMRFTATLSISADAFESVLESTACLHPV